MCQIIKCQDTENGRDQYYREEFARSISAPIEACSVRRKKLEVRVLQKMAEILERRRP
jgi:hypothetical protein